MFVRITYSNGYCICDETEVLQVKDKEEAKLYAIENVMSYAESYEHLADISDEEDINYYYDNCTYNIEEITKEEYQNEM